MEGIYDVSSIRIPVKLVNGKWVYLFGGDLPIKNDAVGDLVVLKSSVEDKKFLANLRRISNHKILDVGATLLVALTVKHPKGIHERLMKHLLPIDGEAPILGPQYYHTPRSGDTRFVKVTLGEPNERQKRKNPKENGGLWLNLEGDIPKGVITSTVLLPEGLSDKRADSLNHAFTMLSERYEPWRMSHTGNIYSRILYQEENKKWYPLSVLRNPSIASDENELILSHWKQIAKGIEMPNE